MTGGFDVLLSMCHVLSCGVILTEYFACDVPTRCVLPSINPKKKKETTVVVSEAYILV